MYAAALTTPEGVISEQPNIADVSQLPRDSSSTPRQKAEKQFVMYVAASTTPQGVPRGDFRTTEYSCYLPVAEGFS